MFDLEDLILESQLRDSLNADQLEAEARWADVVAVDLDSLGQHTDARAERRRAKCCRMWAEKVRSK